MIESNTSTFKCPHLLITLSKLLKQKNYVISGVSFPRNILSKIDKDRGPIPTSRYLLKLIEIAYNTNKIKSQEQIFMNIKEKDALNDVCPPRLASNKTNIIHKETPYEYS